MKITERWMLPLLLLAIAATPGGATARGSGQGGAIRTFVTGLYDAYGRPPGPDYLGKDAPAVFTPSLVATIRRVQQRNVGHVGPGLDADPICSCQDDEGLKMIALRIGGGDTMRATASVALRWPSGETGQVKLDLVATPGGWRVADVHSTTMGSFQAALARDR